MIKFLEKHYRLSIVIIILLAVFIFYMSNQSFDKISNDVGFRIYTWETIAYHFVIFSVLCLFICFSIVKGKPSKKLFIFLAIAITIVYGITDELHQLFIPGRFCDIIDVMIDSFGALSAGIIYYLRLKFRR